MAKKTKEQIKAYLNQCGQLDYDEFIDFIDSVLFDDDNQDIAPICQVTRYRRYRDVNQALSVTGLFDEDNGLVSIYVHKKTTGSFSLSVGITAGGAEITAHEIDDSLVSIDCTYLFDEPTPVYVSGFDGNNIADVIVVYNSFLCDDNGEISMSLLEDIQNRLTDLQDELDQRTISLQEQINTLSTSLIQIPAGVVVQWTGALADIPVGWQRYTGNGSLFLIGESVEYPVGQTGGEKEVVLSVGQLPEHHFKLFANSTGDARVGSDIGPNSSVRKGTTTSGKRDEKYSLLSDSIDPSVGRSSTVGSGEAHNNMPPYKSVIYIIKL